MTPYWFLFGIWLVGTFHFTRSSKKAYSPQAFAIAAVFTAFMIGLRYEVGGDWAPYLAIYNNIYFQPLIPALGLSDPGYAFVNWLAAQIGVSIWFVNLICATLFVAGVGRLASRQSQPWLAMLVAVPYFIIVVAMGYTRQAAAIGIVCFGIADGTDKNIVRTMILIGFAALFHKTALLMLPLVLGPIALRRFLTMLIGIFFFSILFILLLRDQSSQLISNYAQSNYDSQGASIRIAMNVLAGALFLVLRKRMDLSPYQRSFWTLNALLTFLSVVALLSLSSSSGVDRISLFLIPLQMVALSSLPQALSRSGKPVPSAFLGVTAYCFAVQFVWLNFADNAISWIPYSTVILHD